MNNWWIYKGNGKQYDGIDNLPPSPKWRQFNGEVIQERQFGQDPNIEGRFGNIARGERFITSDDEIDHINAALYLRRPLLVTGKPGTGKSSLAYSVAYELKLGQVLCWPVTSRSTLQDGLYRYDAIGRLQASQLEETKPDIGEYLRLGPLGTALLPTIKPRVLLIDEIDKSDIDFPNDLLNIFEEGRFEIPELSRMAETSQQVEVLPFDGQDKVKITKGEVICNAFPFVVITSNGEKELSPPFLRRCIRLDIREPSPEKLNQIIQVHFTDLDNEDRSQHRDNLIKTFLGRRERGYLATDQLMNAIYLVTQGVELESADKDKDQLIDTILRHLSAL